MISYGILFMGLAFAGGAVAAPLTLENYLESVQAHSPEARTLGETIRALVSRAGEANLPLMAEGYASYSRYDDQKPTLQPIFMGTDTQGEQWRVGIRKQTDFGLGANLYWNAQRTVIENANPLYLTVPDYMETSAVLQLTQSLWRNGFGEATKAQVDITRSGNEMDLLQQRFNLKNLLLNARNVYWSIVSSTQIVRLQTENVARALKLRDYMRNRTQLRLFDDTDAMQAQAALDTRELELQRSLDDRLMMVRQFNTLRGEGSDTLPELEPLPISGLMAGLKTGSTHMSREDFNMLRAQAKGNLARAKFASSQIKPQVDLVASVATNGHDGLTAQSYAQAESTRYPTWSVGVNVSVPLDFGLGHELNRGYRATEVAADDLNNQAKFSETRMWEDLLKQKSEAQGRYDRAFSVEKIQTQLVQREKQRLLNGRATTFEAINFEQNLALAQIQRVRAELDLMQIHNVIKTFEAQP